MAARRVLLVSFLFFLSLEWGRGWCWKRRLWALSRTTKGGGVLVTQHTTVRHRVLAARSPWPSVVSRAALCSLLSLAVAGRRVARCARARELVVAGYCLYGSATDFVVTFRAGVERFTLDDSFGEVRRTRERRGLSPSPTAARVRRSRRRRRRHLGGVVRSFGRSLPHVARRARARRRTPRGAAGGRGRGAAVLSRRYASSSHAARPAPHSARPAPLIPSVVVVVAVRRGVAEQTK